MGVWGVGVGVELCWRNRRGSSMAEVRVQIGLTSVEMSAVQKTPTRSPPIVVFA